MACRLLLIQLIFGQNIDKMNKKLKEANSLQTLHHFLFEQTRSLWQAKCGTRLVLDIEAWEFEYDMITEVGWAKVRWDSSELQIFTKGHLIIEEH